MPTCREMCPIAKPQSERKEEKGRYPDGGPYETISAVSYGVTVTALENDEFPHVASTQISKDAEPSCNLAERITRMMHKVGADGGTEDCVYVPEKRAWVTVSK